ncbi:MAG: penicillin-binding protein 1A [Alphaproteobacteria bacterium]|nr:penicillin-binding protein 1A [Alphaproteobacteria bacterium]
MLRFVLYLLVAAVVLAIVGTGGALYAIYHFARGLPDYQQLAVYEPPTVTRVHAADGRLLAEYAVEKRVFVPLAAMPKRVVQAFLSAEDRYFFEHPGVNVLSIVRAGIQNLRGISENKRPVGGSTITQQVAKNFLLTNEVTIERKIKEAILAFRIEKALTKERILELYLNEIYLGFGSYGVAAAALNYFNRSLDELTLAETAFLAALPKAPTNYHPIRRALAAKARRDWVIEQMIEDGVITATAANAAKAEPLEVRQRSEAEIVRADYFTEEVRRSVLARFGDKQLYEGGLSVWTTLDPRLQAIATESFRNGLEIYDRRHGWRGPVTRIPLDRQWQTRLSEVEPPKAIGRWYLAAVLDLRDNGAELGFANGTRGFIPLAEMTWARPRLEGLKLGNRVQHPRDVLALGDVVMVEPVPGGGAGAFALRQIPDVGGALVALDPHTGRVLAMVGGYDYADSQFNRVTQAKRQPGSAFKPIVYLAALDNGFTPSSLVLDGPIVIDQGPGLGKWRPSNYSPEFYGPSTLRLGIEKSRNLMTIRLARFIGMDKVSDYAKRLGVVDEMPQLMSMALGASETTLLRLATAYGVMVNGGKRVQPTIIDRIQDRRGRTIYRHDERACAACQNVAWRGQAEPELPDQRQQVIEPQTAYQMVSMLEGVVHRGTGARIAREVPKALAGKTGTTNEFHDAWFIGFTPDLVVGIYVGYDQPKSLGSSESGSAVSVPIFIDFMRDALADAPNIPFRIPPGVRLVRVEAATGLPARPGDRSAILEAFRPGTEPSVENRVVLDGSDPRDGPALGPTRVGGSTGGLY